MSDNLSDFQAINMNPKTTPSNYRFQVPRERRWQGCCLSLVLIFLVCLCLFILIPPLIPGRTNVLLLGVDARPGQGNLGRTDTMILTTFQPLKPYVGMLTIPRDLEVILPNGDQNRINTAYFYSEASEQGDGPEGAMEVVRDNFGVDVHHYVLIRFDGLLDVVNALGGITVDLPREMSGFPQGTHTLDSTQALAFVRDRTGSDLFRNEHAIIFMKGLMKTAISPANWLHAPKLYTAIMAAIDTDLTPWQYPRLAIALLRVGTDGIDGRTITYDMVTPTTIDGASVLLPIWERINPVLLEVFGQ